MEVTGMIQQVRLTKEETETQRDKVIMLRLC